MPRKATGCSLHIGVNVVDPNRYGGWDGKLNACENDATDMAAIARASGFDATLLLSPQATVDAVTQHVDEAAEKLRDGDIYFLTYAGHGGQIKDEVNGDEEDGRDETWCLYDRQLLDDELYFMWAKFEKGVRILLFSDSCHSGTVSRDAVGVVEMNAAERLAAYGTETPAYRMMPDDKLKEAYRALRKRYRDIQQELAQYDISVDASLRLLSGCQDDQLSAEHRGNGLFTRAVKSVWNNGAFQGNYDEFHQELLKLMPAKQTPNHRIEGVSSAAFDKQRPFAI